MNEFVPRGYLTLKKALEHFGKLKHADKWEAEKASSQQEFQQLLFEETVPAELFTDDGDFESLPSRDWGGVGAEQIFETERSSISGGDYYFPATVHGRVLIKKASIDALFDGDSDEVETGAEDPPAQTLPPHDKPDPQEPADPPLPAQSTPVEPRSQDARKKDRAARNVKIQHEAEQVWKSVWKSVWKNGKRVLLSKEEIAERMLTNDDLLPLLRDLRSKHERRLSQDSVIRLISEPEWVRKARSRRKDNQQGIQEFPAGDI